MNEGIKQKMFNIKGLLSETFSANRDKYILNLLILANISILELIASQSTIGEEKCKNDDT